MEEYLTISEMAARLKIQPKTLRNKMAAGIFEKGVHYFSPPGLGPRFKWSAVVQWIEARERDTATAGDTIPMARNYDLGNPRTKCA